MNMLESLVRLIPGQDINISSMCVDDILNLLDSKDINSSTVILTNRDVWRYNDSLSDIFSHPKLTGRRVILQNLNYTNTKINDNHYTISFPVWYWSRKKISANFRPLENNLTYGFSCLNNNNNIHRTLLGYKLYVAECLPEIIFTQNVINRYFLHRVLEDAPELNLTRYSEYLDLLPIKHHSEITTNNFKDDHSIDHEAYQNAYCNIVTESETEEYPYFQNINLPVITEKSYKPFLSRQIPLMLAPQGHVKYLQGLGFDLMTDLLPNGFDDLPVLQKIDAIVGIVNKGQEFIKDFYFSHLPELQHNYELVNSDKVENIITQRINNILND